MARSVTIIMHDTLWAAGLAALVHDNFGLHASILRSVSQVDDSQADGSSLFITTEHAFVTHLQFFLPKKDRTILVTKRHHPTAGQPAASPLVIFADDDEAQILQALTPLCNDDSAVSSASKLTDREISVLKLVASGYINKEIADQLNISINTVLSHRKNITAKLGIKSVSGLSVYAIMNGIISTPVTQA